MIATNFEFQDSLIPQSRRYLMARRLLQNWGKTSNAYVTLHPQNGFFFESAGEAYIAYRLKFGAAITIGDPVGSPKGIVRCILQFIEQCRKKNLSPVFFMIENSASLCHKLGLKGLRVAEDMYLNIDKLQFKGKNWQDVRTALNRAKREQVEFHKFDSARDSAGLLHQFQKISGEWMRNKRLPELGFTLGSVETVTNPAVRTYYALDSQSQVQGFVSWLPISASQGWVLDLMRKKNGAMPGLMEFLIAKSVHHFKEEGYSCLSLGPSPLPSSVLEDELSGKGWLLLMLKTYLKDYYSFDGLYAFKKKFQPESKPLYLFYPNWLALTRSGFGIMSLYLLQNLMVPG
jgi:lysylphosphatidylglycerol synthetase-like protein (DUF2156 family)